MRRVTLFTLAILALLTACTTTTTSSPTSTSDNASVQVIEVEAYQFGWEPNPIRVTNGTPVRLKMTSRDVAHGIGIPAFGVSKRIPGNGETVTVEFTPDKTGTYNFICNVYCGSGHSAMTGRLIVEAE